MKNGRRPLTKKECAALGGQALVKKLGRQHIRKIGRRGFEVIVREHFDGDEVATIAWLTKKGYTH